jgi:HPt (histidine-containing phosphotransfer) domain-containing protein
MIKHYSIESLREIAGGDAEFMAVVAQTFLDEIPPDLQAMEDAIENDNKELAYQFAHKMKPNLEMFGIDVLKDITTIESWTKTSKNKASVDENVRNITKSLRAVFIELKADFDLG